VGSLSLPDVEDRHVLAAAIRAKAGVIVTFNVKHFLPEALDPHGIEAQHPDEVASRLFDLSPGAVCAAVRDQRKAPREPPQSVVELLDSFRSLGLATTVGNLRTMEELL